MEDLVFKVGRGSHEVRRNGTFHLAVQPVNIEAMMRVGIKDPPEGQQVLPLGGLIETDPEVIGIDYPKIDP